MFKLVYDLGSGPVRREVGIGEHDVGTVAAPVGEVELEQPGAHVGILANNGHRYWETYFAAHYAGTPLAPLNIRLGARELADSLGGTAVEEVYE